MASQNFGFAFENSYAESLEGFYAPWKGAEVPAPKIVKFNHDLALELNLDPSELNTDDGAAVLAGSLEIDGTSPLAMVYAGHQFGGFSQQLGDGRALLLGELIDRNGKRRDLHLKGSGATPFSRNGDGKAALGPVLREYLIGEAMHGLGIPTTRALAAVTTGEMVRREKSLPGAVLARIASSHIRVGTFQFFAARGETEKVKQLADYAISRHYPDLSSAPDKYRRFLSAVIDRQAYLIAKWMLVGFIHGVMNTDNTTISGETIDYGPCAFMDVYNSSAVFSSIDQFGRYAYDKQPNMAQWNLARLAETLLPLIDPDNPENAVELATAEINKFNEIYEEYWLCGMRAKLGLTNEEPDDVSLANSLLSVLDGNGIDFTAFFKGLSELQNEDDSAIVQLFDDPSQIQTWLNLWRERRARQSATEAEQSKMMQAANPIYVPRNHLVEEALHEAVENQNMALFNELLKLVSNPYQQADANKKFTQKAPQSFSAYQTFCGT